MLLRVNAPAHSAFGVDRGREAALLAAIRGRRWAPDLIAVDAGLRWLVMPHYDGAPPAPDDPDAVDALLTAVADWQRREWPLAPIRYARLLARYRDALPPLAGDPVGILARALETLPAVAPTLVHHDLHAGNLLCTPHGLKLLDWEYGGLGNPWFDLAALRQRFDVDSERLHALPGASALDRGAFEWGLAVACGVTALLDLLWYRVRLEVNDEHGIEEREARIEAATARLAGMLAPP